MSRKYKRNRRSPVAHRVSSHRRSGFTVKSYGRGSGSRGSGVPRQRVKSNVEAFTVTLKYKTGKSEKINVFAPRGSYKKALDEALEERTRKAMPVEVNILDPSLGEVISYIGKGVGTGLKYAYKGTRKAVGYTARGARVATVALARGALTSGQKIEAKRLVKKSYSSDPTERVFARRTLKRKYPEIYDNCDFSARLKYKPKSKLKIKKKSKSKRK